LTLKFLDVTKLTNITPVSLLISCKLLFLMVGFKMSSLPTLALKSHNRIFIWYFGNLSNTDLKEKIAAPVYKTEITAVGIHHADHVAHSISKSWH
jgi:hypothetical protein